MKKKLLFIVLVAGAALLTACQESSEMSNRVSVALHANYLHPERVDFQLPNASAATMELTIQSQDTPWTISNVPDWITVSPTSGNSTTTVTISVPEQTRATSRVGVFTLASGSSDWSYTKQITVTQPGATPYFELDKRSFSFDGAANTETVPIRSNFDVQINNNGYGWINVSSHGSEMEVSVSANDSGALRVGSVDIVFNNQVMASITVSQIAGEFSVVVDPLNYGINGGSYKLSITTQAGWRINNNDHWLDISPKNGSAGTTEVTVTASPNDGDYARDGYLYIVYAGSSYEIASMPVHQDGVVMELEEVDMQNFSAVGGTEHIRLISNVDWAVTEVPSFLTISPMSGSGTTDVTLEIADNPTFDEKFGTLAFNRVGTGYSISTQVRQRSRTPNFENGTWLTCNDVPQTVKLNVDTDGPWGIVYERSFFDVTPTSSSGKQTINFIVDENKGGWRQGSANFRPHGVEGYDDSGESSWWIYVNQDGWLEKYHEIPEAVVLGEGIAGETYTQDIDIATTDDWSAEILDNPGWVRVAGTSSGAGSGKLQIAFDGNPSVQPRSAQVRITFRYLDAVILTLRQLGRHVEVNTNTIYFFEQGGAVLFSASTNGDPYIVGKEGGDWFTVEKESGSPYKNYRVVASQMSGTDERTGYVVLTLDGIPASTYQLKIPVIQMTAAGMTRGGFTEDRNLNIVTAPGLSITVTSYSEDQNWSGSRQAQIGGEGYDDDENWN